MVVIFSQTLTWVNDTVNQIQLHSFHVEHNVKVVALHSDLRTLIRITMGNNHCSLCQG